MSYYWDMDFYLVSSIFFGSSKKGFLRDYPFLKKLKSNVMKLRLLIGAAVLITACSSPKYTYHFDHYDYNSGKKLTKETLAETSPLLIDDQSVLSAASSHSVAPAVSQKTQTSGKKAKLSPEAISVVEKYKAMSKVEQKAFKKELKKEIKSHSRAARNVEGVESVKATKAFDTYSALALLFGGAGVVMIMLAAVSNVFWVLGAIAFVIGAFFFVKWVSDGNG
jgi:hypothetical protein